MRWMVSNQQVDQIIGQRPCTQKHKCGQPGDARRGGMAAQFMRCLDHNTAPAALQIARRCVIEQISWQVEVADQLKLGQFLLHAGKTRPARVAAQCQQHRRYAARDLRGTISLRRTEQCVQLPAHHRR